MQYAAWGIPLYIILVPALAPITLSSVGESGENKITENKLNIKICIRSGEGGRG